MELALRVRAGGPRYSRPQVCATPDLKAVTFMVADESEASS